MRVISNALNLWNFVSKASTVPMNDIKGRLNKIIVV